MIFLPEIIDIEVHIWPFEEEIDRRFQIFKFWRKIHNFKMVICTTSMHPKTKKTKITGNKKFPIWLEPARAQKQLWISHWCLQKANATSERHICEPFVQPRNSSSISPPVWPPNACMLFRAWTSSRTWKLAGLVEIESEYRKSEFQNRNRLKSIFGDRNRIGIEIRPK